MRSERGKYFLSEMRRLEFVSSLPNLTQSWSTLSTCHLYFLAALCFVGENNLLMLKLSVMSGVTFPGEVYDPHNSKN